WAVTEDTELATVARQQKHSSPTHHHAIVLIGDPFEDLGLLFKELTVGKVSQRRRMYRASGPPNVNPPRTLSQNDLTCSTRASTVSASQPNSSAARCNTSRSTYFSPNLVAISWPI